MISSFKIVSENRDRRFVTIKEVSGLKICKSIYQPGYWFETEFYTPTAVDAFSSKHFITVGKITEKAGLLPDRVAGWRTWEDTGMVPAGTYLRESLEGCEIWCVLNGAEPGGRVDHVSVVFLRAGEQYTIPDRSNMFFACGALLLNEVALEAETPYVLRNGERVVLAESDSYFMHWPLIEPAG